MKDPTALLVAPRIEGKGRASSRNGDAVDDVVVLMNFVVIAEGKSQVGLLVGFPSCEAFPRRDQLRHARGGDTVDSEADEVNEVY